MLWGTGDVALGDEGGIESARLHEGEAGIQAGTAVVE